VRSGRVRFDIAGALIELVTTTAAADSADHPGTTLLEGALSSVPVEEERVVDAIVLMRWASRDGGPGEYRAWLTQQLQQVGVIQSIIKALSSMVPYEGLHGDATREVREVPERERDSSFLRASMEAVLATPEAKAAGCIYVTLGKTRLDDLGHGNLEVLANALPHNKSRNDKSIVDQVIGFVLQWKESKEVPLEIQNSKLFRRKWLEKRVVPALAEIDGLSDEDVAARETLAAAMLETEVISKSCHELFVATVASSKESTASQRPDPELNDEPSAKRAKTQPAATLRELHRALPLVLLEMLAK